MRILIADDEKLVRYSVRSIIEELPGTGPEVPGPFTIEEASTGTLLKEMVHTFRPHLVFADIRMPGMTGLEAIEACIDEHPDIKWIILTGYSDFDYARKALSLRVLDYMLKPVDPAELKAALLRAAAELEKERVIRNSVFEKKMVSIVQNLSSPEDDPSFSDNIFFSGLLIMPRGDTGGDTRLRRNLVDALNRRWSNGFLDFTAAFITLENGGAAVVFRNRSEVSPVPEEKKYLESEFPELNCRPGGNHRSVSDLLDALEQISLDDPGSIITESEELSGNPPAAELSLLVRQACEFAEKHFSEAIGVAQAAEYLKVTPNYLSAVFKKEKGLTFTSFITALRMKEALVLLKQPGVSVKETAFALGYQSARHFARVFRELQGESPSEFVRQG